MARGSCVYPWARQSEPAPFCYISIALAFVHSCQAIIRDKKNRLGCFWSRFSSQEECRRRKCYHEKMEAIRPSTSESEQKSIGENICFVFCLTCDFYRFCRLYVLQEQIKKRVKVRLNRRQFRWIFVDRLKSKIKKKKDLKKCGSNWVKATLDKIP